MTVESQEEVVDHENLEAPPSEGMEAQATESSEPEASGEEESTVPVTEEYTPNYSFKVMDEEREFDDRVRGYIKSKEDEEYFRDIMQRAYGLDYVKKDRETLREENTSLQEVRGQFDTVVNDLQNVGRFVQNGDFGNFFDSMQIPREKVYQWVLEQAELQRLQQENPQQYNQYMRNQNVLNQNYQLQQERDMLIKEQQATRVSQIHNQMDYEMSQPDVQQAASVFNERVGNPDAFRQEVINRGRAHYARTGVDLPPAEIINQVMMLGGFQRGQQVQQPQHQTPSQPRPRREVETLPNVSGRSTSPVKKKPRSFQDLYKIRDQIMQQA